MLLKAFPSFYSHTTEFFILRIAIEKRETHIVMELKKDKINTSQIPCVFSMLEKQLPNIFYSQCFNEKQLPFHIEVKSTELGHLFEHILLEYLCQIKMANGYDNVEYSGITDWNWKVNKRGTFNIAIDAGFSERIFLIRAIQKSSLLMRSMFEKDFAETTALSFPFPSINSVPFREFAVAGGHHKRYSHLSRLSSISSGLFSTFSSCFCVSFRITKPSTTFSCHFSTSFHIASY